MTEKDAVATAETISEQRMKRAMSIAIVPLMDTESAMSSVLSIGADDGGKTANGMVMGMDELAYARYLKRADRAEETYRTIRELYGWEIPWKKSYFMAIKDKLLTKEDKDLVKEFHPVR